MLSTSANNGAMSSPRAFAAPMALERALRSACNVSVLTCKSLRCSSNAVSFSVSRIKLLQPDYYGVNLDRSLEFPIFHYETDTFILARFRQINQLKA